MTDAKDILNYMHYKYYTCVSPLNMGLHKVPSSFSYCILSPGILRHTYFSIIILIFSTIKSMPFQYVGLGLWSH